MLDADAFLTNPQTLNLLIAKNKTIVAPMLKSDGMYSNFWAGMAPNHYYMRTERYEPILERKEIGCHEVPMVHSALLINLQKLESDSLTYDFQKLDNYDGPKDDIITFALSANISDVFLYVCNDEIYGHILVPLENHEPISREVDHLINLKLELLGNEESLKLNEGMKKFVKYPKKDTLGFDKVYMINLERRPERRARMEQCFEELGILSETINAVDGRTLNSTALDKWGVKIMPNYADPYRKRPMTMGEIGCFLSHYVIWKKAFDNNFDRIMVLEDDVRFEPFFRQRIHLLLNEIDQLHLQWDLIYLGRKKISKEEESPVDGSKLLWQVGYSYWTIGYMLSQSGVKKLLDARPLDNMIPVDEYLPILFDRHPKDDWKEYFPQRNLVAFSVEPLALYPTRYTGETGYISDTEDSNVITVKNHVEGLVKTEL
ncbi:glycosyltransferase 25 family member isoform X2 [Venturia canescens]|nr:glycosyltransferase 25 family member isoform X2 [Venturia canescens]